LVSPVGGSTKAVALAHRGVHLPGAAQPGVKHHKFTSPEPHRLPAIGGDGDVALRQQAGLRLVVAPPAASNGSRTSTPINAVIASKRRDAVRWRHHHPPPVFTSQRPYSCATCRRTRSASSSSRACSAAGSPRTLSIRGGLSGCSRS
jgi:hypothetical protein